MSGRLIVIAIVILSLLTGGAIYYLQVYHFYTRLGPKAAADVALLPKSGGAPEQIAVADFDGVDADSSPLRYRACFRVTEGPNALMQRYETRATATPLNAPYWFSCFDARRIGEDIDAGLAQVFVAYENQPYGFDRLVAIYPDGRGFAWNEMNACGIERYESKSFNPKCPPPVQQ